MRRFHQLKNIGCVNFDKHVLKYSTLLLLLHLVLFVILQYNKKVLSLLRFRDTNQFHSSDKRRTGSAPGVDCLHWIAALRTPASKHNRCVKCVAALAFVYCPWAATHESGVTGSSAVTPTTSTSRVRVNCYLSSWPAQAHKQTHPHTHARPHTHSSAPICCHRTGITGFVLWRGAQHDHSRTDQWERRQRSVYE